jgi:hypothetical protein
MNESERLTLRARQLLDDPTLSQNLRVPNASALLKALAQSVQGAADRRAAVLDSIADNDVRMRLDAALNRLGA